jgi:hypothetical protein
MKNMNIVLIIAAILATSVGYADCPPVNTIYVDRDDHFVAQGLGGIWRDPQPTGGYIPGRVILAIALSSPIPGEPGVGNNFSCGYGDQDTGHLFGLMAPTPDLKYQIGPGGYWNKPSPPFPQYYCEPMTGNVTECPFSMAQ